MDRKKFFKRGLRVLKDSPYLVVVVREWLDNPKEESCPIGYYLRGFPAIATEREKSPYVKRQLQAFSNHPKVSMIEGDYYFRQHCQSICFRFFPFEESLADSSYTCPCVRYEYYVVVKLLRELLYRNERRGHVQSRKTNNGH
jgi:hypothetical protein